MNQSIFINNKIYHVYNRGTDKRNIFLEEEDYLRFIHDLFEFNDTAPALNIYYKAANLQNPQSYEVPLRKIERKPRELTVKILTFCLMPNHFHLLIEQVKNGGITAFMRKLGTGYTNYFNKKYERSGVLFQGKFKSIMVEEEKHFLHLPYYIHCNPLDLVMPEWREKEIKDHKKAMQYLENYRWSSFPDYIGKKNFPSVTQREFLTEFFGNPEQYKKDVEKWLKEMALEDLNDIVLDNK